MSSHKKHVFLIEDDQALRLDLIDALQFAGYSVHDFGDPDQFLLEFRPLVPAVLITDMRMPNKTGIQLQEELVSKGHRLPIIFISGESTDQQIVKAFNNGAFDFLLKPFGREALFSVAAKAMEKDIIAMTDHIRKAQLTESLKILSPRERQVFELMAKGYGNKELVEALGVSLPTVKEYKSEMMHKLRLRSLAELMALNSSI
jgi:FixJ family two-component response regulator